MANDGSIEISITGDADELKKEIEAVSKLTKEHSTQAKKSSQGVKSETDTLKKSLELMGKAGKTAYNSLKTTGEVAMKSIATAATTSVSVMGGVATAAVNVGKSFESGMSTVASVSGATGAELEKLRAKAKEMGATTAFSATQATDAMNYMAMAGWKTNEMISGIDGIMNLAAASGADLATTSDIVTDALTAFGMTAKDSAEFADVMAAASSNANTNVELMGATFKYVGAAAGAMGYSIQDIAVATGLMANAGIKGEMAGTALRSTITRLAKPTKESQEAMDALGVSLTDSKGKMKSFGEIMTDMRKGMSKMTEDEKASYAAMLGGQEAMSGLLAIANASDADFAKLTKAIEGSTGAAEKMAKVKLDNLEGDITILKSGLEGFGIQIYEEMQKPLRNAAQQATDMVSDLSKAFSKDGFEGVITEGGKIISNLLTVVAQKSPKIIDVGFSFVDSIIKGIQQNSNKLTGTALLIVDKIADGIKNTSTNLMPLVGDFANVFVQGVLKYKDVFWSVAFDMVTAIAQGLSDHAGEISSGIVTLINNIVAKMDESLPVFIEAASNLLINVFETLADNMPDISNNISKMITKICDLLIKNLPKIIKATSDLIISVFDAIAKKMPNIANDLTKLVKKIGDALLKNAPKLASSLGKLLGEAVKGLVHNIGQLSEALSDILKAVWEGAFSLVAGVFGIEINWDANKSELDRQLEQLQPTLDKLDEINEAYSNYKTARDDIITDTTGEFDYYERLWEELHGIVDENGKIKTGYEERARFITETLNGALGTNLEIENDTLTNYKNQGTEIDKLIQKKQALALQDALGSSYTEAITSITDAESSYTSALAGYDKLEKAWATDRLNALDATIEAGETDGSANAKNFAEYARAMKSEIESAGGTVEAIREVTRHAAEKYGTWGESFASSIDDFNNDEEVQKYKKKLEEAEDAVVQYRQNISDYEELTEALESDNETAVNDLVQRIKNNFITAENGTERTLKKQVEDLDQAISDEQYLIDNDYKSIADSHIDQLKEERKRAKEQYDLMLKDREEAIEQEKLIELKKQANEIYEAFLNDEDGNGDGWGAEIGTSLFEGIIAGLQKSSSMEDQNLAMVLDTQVRQARKALGINSPSKVTKKMLGEPMGQGVTVGNVKAIKEGAKDVEKAIDDDLLRPLSKKSFSLSPNVILAAQQTARSTAQRAASSVTTTNIHNITNNAYQQTQQTSGDRYVQESIISFERGVNDLVDFLAPKIETRTRRVGRKAVAKLG